MAVFTPDEIAICHAAELQARVDEAAVALLEQHGQLAVAVHCNPAEQWAGWILGYTVALDPEHPLGTVTLR